MDISDNTSLFRLLHELLLSVVEINYRHKCSFNGQLLELCEFVVSNFIQLLKHLIISKYY